VIWARDHRNGQSTNEPHSRSLPAAPGLEGEPKETSYSEGRFLVLADSYLDPYIFGEGKDYGRRRNNRRENQASR